MVSTGVGSGAPSSPTMVATSSGATPARGSCSVRVTCSPKVGTLNAITTWPPIGSNAASSASATIVSPSLHTRSFEVGCVVSGSARRSASTFLRARCKVSPHASRSLDALTAKRSQNV
ncbi:MAG: hypothetical protein NT062_11350 [Proteobacteria bacterium]|nr:hypothetical protein [Pseudomonadota bacterium]